MSEHAPIKAEDLERLIMEVVRSKDEDDFFERGDFEEGAAKALVQVVVETYPELLEYILESIAAGRKKVVALGGSHDDPMFHLAAVEFTSGFQIGWEAHRQFRSEREIE